MKTKNIIKIQSNKFNPRQKVRILNLHNCITSAIDIYKRCKIPSFRISHGGGVANAYNYPATTQCCLVLVMPVHKHARYVYVWTGNANAHCITFRKAAESCLYDAAKIYDSRTSQDTKDRYRKKIIQEATNEHNNDEYFQDYKLDENTNRG
jgi:hypothetical protein